MHEDAFMKLRHKRFAAIAAVLAALGGATALVLTAFQGNLVFFFSPSQIASNEAPIGKSFRLGGLVQTGTVARDHGGVTVSFVVTDTVHATPVVYRGILPDLFREGKGVVAQGRLDAGGVFRAQQVLERRVCAGRQSATQRRAIVG